MQILDIKACSRTGYVFICGDSAISWRSTKQTLTATSSNHTKILALHEASRECIRLRLLIQHINETCGLSFIKECPTVIYEDNTACITQVKGRYIKGDRTKHTTLKLFFTRELQKKGDIDVHQVRSSDNLADLFTKALPTTTFEKLVNKIVIRRLRDLYWNFSSRHVVLRERDCCSLFLDQGFVPIGYPGKVFNEAIIYANHKVYTLFFPSLRFFATRFFLGMVFNRAYSCVASRESIMY